MALKQNIIYIYFKGKHLVTSKSQYQYNHGQFLYFADLNLPQAFEVHFSNKDKGFSKPQVGSNKLVEIPDEYYWSGAQMIYAWIYLHSDIDDGETVYEVRMPLIKRAKPTDEEPLPQQESAMERAIAELNTAVEITNENANKTGEDRAQVSDIRDEVVDLKEDIDATAETVAQNAQDAIDASRRFEASAQNAAEFEDGAHDYSEEALSYRDETKGYRNDVQTLKGQIDETADAVSEDAHSAREDADFLRNASATATTLAAGSEATVNLTDGQFAFGIPSGEDAVGIQIDTDAVVIHTGADGVFTKDEIVKIHTAFYDGKTLKSTVPHAPKIKIIKEKGGFPPQIISQEISPYVSFGFEHDVSWSLNKGWKLRENPTIVALEFVYDGVTYTKNIPIVMINDGANGEKGDTGESGVYIGAEEPTDESVNVWIDTDATADGVVTDVQVNGTSVVNNGIANITEIPTSLKYVKDDPSDNGGVIVGHVSENTASGWNAYAEGGGTTASATCAHAEGAGTRATGGQAHSEGGGTTASGAQAHAEGASTIASGDNSHAENLATTASGACSHASGVGTIAQRKSQFVIGEHNKPDLYGVDMKSKGEYVFIVGNGDSGDKSNAFGLKWDGTFVFANGTEITPAQFAALLQLLS